MEEEIIDIEGVDLADFKDQGYLEEVNNEWFVPNGLRLIYMTDAFTEEEIFTIIKVNNTTLKTGQIYRSTSKFWEKINE